MKHKTTRKQLIHNIARCLSGLGLVAALGCESRRARTVGWRSLTPAPTKRTEVGAAEFGGRLYVAGGYLLSDETVATVEAYDVAGDAWETGAPLPAPRNHLTLTALQGRIFAVGGNDGIGGAAEQPTASVWAFAPETGRWNTVAPLPASRAAHAAATDGKLLYIVGGIGSDPRPTLAYDPVADRWEKRAPIPTERDHLGCALLGGQVVAVAGRTGEREQAVVEAYDVARDAWTTLPPLPTARHGLVAVAVRNTVFAIGGETFAPEERTFAVMEAWDRETAVWRALPPMPTARHGAGGAVYQGKLYVLAGGPLPDLSATDAVEVYSPEE